jgi:hypothetical protein
MIPCILLIIPREEFAYPGRTETQQKILLVLSNLANGEKSTARQISIRCNLKFNTVYKELQRLVRWNLIIKEEKSYCLNPEYSELLLRIALKLKGVNQPPKWFIVIEKVEEVMKILSSIKKIEEKVISS